MAKRKLPSASQLRAARAKTNLDEYARGYRSFLYGSKDNGSEQSPSFLAGYNAAEAEESSISANTRAHK